MTSEQREDLLDEYHALRSETGSLILILLVSHGTFFFCAFRRFIFGAIIALIISGALTVYADRKQDRMKRIRWELDRG